ncbi:MAG TPA: DUF3093 domain-containing protein [Streptosporangiaceae bacterium]|nr:DUF3093 domain-containing protein [Streptosporangiaceae bacterium]
MRDYHERLYVPVAWWLLAVPVAVILGAYSYVVVRGPWPPVVIAAFVAGAGALLASLGSARVEITEGTLRAGGQELPLSQVTEAIPLDERQTAALRGPQADPAGRLYSRPYLKESVCLMLADPRVPYWLIGTRHPAELAASIDACLTGKEHVA